MSKVGELERLLSVVLSFGVSDVVSEVVLELGP
jgi:hypothetical protein